MTLAWPASVKTAARSAHVLRDPVNCYSPISAILQCIQHRGDNLRVDPCVPRPADDFQQDPCTRARVSNSCLPVGVHGTDHTKCAGHLSGGRCPLSSS